MAYQLTQDEDMSYPDTSLPGQPLIPLRSRRWEINTSEGEITVRVSDHQNTTSYIVVIDDADDEAVVFEPAAALALYELLGSLIAEGTLRDPEASL